MAVLWYLMERHIQKEKLLAEKKSIDMVCHAIGGDVKKKNIHILRLAAGMLISIHLKQSMNRISLNCGHLLKMQSLQMAVRAF